MPRLIDPFVCVVTNKQSSSLLSFSVFLIQTLPYRFLFFFPFSFPVSFFFFFRWPCSLLMYHHQWGQAYVMASNHPHPHTKHTNVGGATVSRLQDMATKRKEIWEGGNQWQQQGSRRSEAQASSPQPRIQHEEGEDREGGRHLAFTQIGQEEGEEGTE